MQTREGLRDAFRLGVQDEKVDQRELPPITTPAFPGRGGNNSALSRVQQLPTRAREGRRQSAK